MAPVDRTLTPASVSLGSESSTTATNLRGLHPGPLWRLNKLSSRRRLVPIVSSSDQEQHVLSQSAKRQRIDFESSNEGSETMSSYHMTSHHSLLNGFTNGHHHGHHLTKTIVGGEIPSMNSPIPSVSKYSSPSVSSLASSKSPLIASLCNLGNTCFSNSVLYTLRFTPGFLHSLHHMVFDLNQQTSGKKRSGSGGPNLSNGFSNGNVDANSGDTSSYECDGMVLEVIEQLHDLFKTLSCVEENNDAREPIPPSSFLNAVGRLNPVFEGNQQQDAHEFLVTILNILEDIKIPVKTSLVDKMLSSSSSSHQSEKNLSELQDGKKSKKKGKLLSNGNLNGSSLSVAASNNGICKDIIQKPHSGRNSPAPTTSSETPEMLPNFVRENFEGKAVMRTRCLECETSTYRPETFTFIDVPLHLDDDDDELNAKELFLKQIMMSETLRENNKYWCEECSRLNEAQRSVQYELLPKIMVLQLKRFTATGAKYMSKINDYIPTPFVMNCFCNQCMPNSTHHNGRHSQPEPKHHYRLYAVIMHLGATLASGHYIAYVRASQTFDPTWDFTQCQRVSTVERNKKKKGIMKFLQRGNNHGESSKSVGDLSSVNGVSNGTMDGTYQLQSCKSTTCCGIRGTLMGMANSSSFDGVTSASSSSFSLHQKSVDSTDSPTDTVGHQQQSMKSSSQQDMDDLWLECDDETIQAISRKQFEDILSAKHGASTPYLLFYQRV